jgi:transcription antitermination factor NusG
MTEILTAPVFGNRSPCASYAETDNVISSSKFGHGGPRPNSGGPRPNSGGARENSGGVRAGAGRPVVAKPDFTGRNPGAPRWYCARTYWHAEKTASRELRDAGYAVFSPSIWLPAVKAWGNAVGATRPAVPERVEPMFPRYVLVQFRRFVDDWKRIRRLPGVEYLFLADGIPIAMPDQAIELIRGLCDVNDCLYPDNITAGERGAAIVQAVPPETPFEVGATARLLDGAMAGRTGICTWSDIRRVKLLMHILHRPVWLTVARERVEAV